MTGQARLAAVGERLLRRGIRADGWRHL